MTGAKQCLLNTHGYHTHELLGAEDQGSQQSTELEGTQTPVPSRGTSDS